MCRIRTSSTTELPPVIAPLLGVTEKMLLGSGGKKKKKEKKKFKFVSEIKKPKKKPKNQKPKNPE
jgi:hypothetical protein